MERLITEFYTILEAVRDFIEMGGPVLTVITIVAFLLWGFMIERLIYMLGKHRRLMRQTVDEWNARGDRSSWHARQIRDRMISQVAMQAERNLPIIKALVVLCPLLGLLGTVTGMVEVFEVMAISGSGNPRSMAAGVSKATVPTMAGMVVALSGVFLDTWLHKKAIQQRELLSENLTTA